jgi:hypothetical protein
MACFHMEKARFSGSTPLRNKPVYLRLMLIGAAALVLGGCGRDADLSEQVAAANAAADRAELAATKAVAAAQTATGQPVQVAAAESEPQPADGDAEPATADDDVNPDLDANGNPVPVAK